MRWFGPSNQDVIAAIEQAATGIQSSIDEADKFAGIRARLLYSALRRVDAKLKVLLMARIVPGHPRVIVVAEEGDTDMLQFEVQLPAPPVGPNDIVSGELIVVINGNPLDPITTDKAASIVQSPDFLAPDNAQVELEFRYMDDAGNRSAPSLLTVTLLDTIAPAIPGVMGITTVAEVFDNTEDDFDDEKDFDDDEEDADLADEESEGDADNSPV